MKKNYFPQNSMAVRCLGFELECKGDKTINKSGKILWRLVILAPIVSGLSVIGKDIAKDMYTWTKNKLIGNSKQGESLTPKVQSLADVRTEAGFENYSDGQLVGKLAYIEDIVILFGEFGTGKTVTALQVAESIATGGNSFIVLEDDGLHKPQVVLYYDGEMDDADYQKIYGDYDVHTVKNLILIRGFYFKDTKSWMEDLKARLKSITADVTVFLDNLSCIASTTSGNTIREFFLNDLKLLQEQFRKQGHKLTFVFLAHTNKEGELAGTQNLSNFGTTVLGLASTDQQDLITLNVVKNRKYGDMKGKSFVLQKKQTAEGRKYMEVLAEAKAAYDDPHKDGKVFYEMRMTGMKDEEIAAKVGFTHETVNRKINAYQKSIKQ